MGTVKAVVPLLSGMGALVMGISLEVAGNCEGIVFVWDVLRGIALVTVAVTVLGTEAEAVEACGLTLD